MQAPASTTILISYSCVAMKRNCRVCALFVLQSFGPGDVVEVKGLAVAVPEGVVVELKQPQGGFVFQRHGSRTLLEEVEALKVRCGAAQQYRQ